MSRAGEQDGGAGSRSFLGGQAPLNVLLVDDCDGFANGMGQSFRELGHVLWLARSFPEALGMVDLCKPNYVISEIRTGGRFIFDFLPDFCERRPLSSLVVATIYPSVATAVRLIQMGAAAYLTKPVSAKAILAQLSRRRDEPVEVEGANPWPSLDRTIWEYLNQVYVAAGSMSEAARRLGVDRRSLRRMLGKYPPVR